MRTLALFDLDGTITKKDTFLEFIRYCYGNVLFYLGFLVLAPAVILFKLSVKDNTWLKELTLGLFFKGRALGWMKQKGDHFSLNLLPHLVKPEMQALLDQLQKDGVEIWIVSASLKTWLAPWCEKHGYQLLCSEGQYFNNMFNGTLEGANCHGEEKVRRIREAIRLEEYDRIIGYGDSPADKPMLALCTEAHYLGK